MLSPSVIALYIIVISFYSATSAFMIDHGDILFSRPKIPKFEQRRRATLGNRRIPGISVKLGMSKNAGQENTDEEQWQGNNNKDDSKNSDEMQNAKQQKNEIKGRHYSQNDIILQQNKQLLNRITQLEALAGSQAVEIRKLREECKSINDATEAFAQVVELLRQAGLSVDQSTATNDSNVSEKKAANSSKIGDDRKIEAIDQTKRLDYVDESEIFGSAPSSVSDAADAAGASILAALLGGKHRMLVDVRDAELSRDPDILVQFIEIAILPVAAGLEGLYTQKNRVKIVFPTVSQLMQYRRSMALAAPEVISLSTLGLDPVEKRDNLVVIIAPSPDDDAGLLQMNELLSSNSFKQPAVILNHHMVPLSGPGGAYDPIYHLRLLTVQYMAGDTLPDRRPNKEAGTKTNPAIDSEQLEMMTNVTQSNSTFASESISTLSPEKEDEALALAAAMDHAHELGVHQGVTRAMVIRAYPKPWHIFVDTSPDTDADFEVAATFDEYPSQDDINYAIVECLEGSEREDELVAQQMQDAIESGQLDSISDMLGLVDVDKKDGSVDEDDDDFYNDWDPWFGADTV
jgi:hypothetical protein